MQTVVTMLSHNCTCLPGHGLRNLYRQCCQQASNAPVALGSKRYLLIATDNHLQTGDHAGPSAAPSMPCNCYGSVGCLGVMLYPVLLLGPAWTKASIFGWRKSCSGTASLCTATTCLRCQDPPLHWRSAQMGSCLHPHSKPCLRLNLLSQNGIFGFWFNPMRS